MLSHTYEKQELITASRTGTGSRARQASDTVIALGIRLGRLGKTGGRTDGRLGRPRLGNNGNPGVDEGCDAVGGSDDK